MFQVIFPKKYPTCLLQKMYQYSEFSLGCVDIWKLNSGFIKFPNIYTS